MFWEDFLIQEIEPRASLMLGRSLATKPPLALTPWNKLDSVKI